jgi:heme-degrading monooxygenase HmoA
VHIILWEFEPRTGKEAEFERAYGANGEWAKLFAKSADYRGTDLLKSATNRTYLTVDRWTSAAAFAEFRQRWLAQYQALDQKMESLTASERSIGAFESV